MPEISVELIRNTILKFEDKLLEEVDRNSIEEEILINHSLMLWDKCRTYDDIKRFQKKFINGDIYCTPYHFGPIFSDTKLKSDILIKINNNGFITIDSQDGHGEKDIDRQFTDIYGYGYLQGYMDKKKVTKFIKLLLEKYGDDYFIIVNDTINFSKNKIIISNEECSYHRWNDSDEILDFESDLLTYSGNIEIINNVNSDNMGQLISQLIETSNIKKIDDFDEYLEIQEILKERCHYIDIIRNKTGISPIIDNTSEILCEINMNQC